MATYNGAKYIQEQLDSLAQQTILPYELVIFDDGSVDTTLSIVNEFSKISPFPVNIYTNKINLGYGENFLKIVLFCKGDWIAFCDQDDVWLPEKLETCQKYMDNSVTMIYHSAYVVDNNLRRLSKFKFQDDKDKTIRLNELLPWKQLAGFSILFNNKLPFYNQYQKRPHDPHRINVQIAHDQWVPFLATIFGNIIYIPIPLVLYRQHEANAMGANLQSKISAKHPISLSANYINLSILALERAHFIYSLIGKADEKQAKSLYAAFRRYTILSQNLHLRHLLSIENSTSRRFWLIIKLVYCHGYGKTHLGGLGFRAFVKDIINCVYNLLRSAQS